MDELIERDRDGDTTADGTLDSTFDSDGKVARYLVSTGLEERPARGRVVDGRPSRGARSGAAVLLPRRSARKALGEPSR
ncbi:MAG TPA: hypothetical protein VH475_15355 [Tepidisphaeraceae bacterium]